MSEEWLVRSAEIASERAEESAAAEETPEESAAADEAPEGEEEAKEESAAADEASEAAADEAAHETEESAAADEASEESAAAAEASEEPVAELDFAEPAPEAGPRCPYCRDPLQDVVGRHEDEGLAASRPVACVECQTAVHARCAQIHGRCVTQGCSGRSFAFVDRVPRPEIRATRILRARAARPRRRPPTDRGPRVVPECPSDWWRRDAPLLVLGLAGILSLALFGDSLAAGAKRFDEARASLLERPAEVVSKTK